MSLHVWSQLEKVTGFSSLPVVLAVACADIYGSFIYAQVAYLVCELYFVHIHFVFSDILMLIYE